MKLKIFRTLWDLPLFNEFNLKKWENQFNHMQKTGYEGIEVAI